MAAGNAVGRHHTHLNRKSSFAGLFVGIRNAAAGAGGNLTFPGALAPGENKVAPASNGAVPVR